MSNFKIVAIKADNQFVRIVVRQDFPISSNKRYFGTGGK